MPSRFGRRITIQCDSGVFKAQKRKKKITPAPIFCRAKTNGGGSESVKPPGARSAPRCRPASVAGHRGSAEHPPHQTTNNRLILCCKVTLFHLKKCNNMIYYVLTRILHEKRKKAWRDREPEMVVKPQPDNHALSWGGFCKFYTTAGSLRFEWAFMQYPG